MRSVRFFYRKTGRLRFISHLDMNRFITRAVRRAGLPVWYTEGFHPHLYVTFPLPLPLGFESDCEIAELKITDDLLSLESAVERLNAVCPEGISFYGAKEAVMKSRDIAFASYLIEFDDGAALKDRLCDFLKRDSIVCPKRTKKGDFKQIDIAPDIKNPEVYANGGSAVSITLPAGNERSINPELFINAFFEKEQEKCPYTVRRTRILTADLKPFS